MSEKPLFDPASAWAELVQRWEQEVNNWSGKLTENEQFSTMLAQATKMSVVAQRSFNEHMEKVLKSLNLPSKVQIDEVTERLERIEEQIEHLNLALKEKGDAPAAAPAPSRTRKPPAEQA